MIFGHSPAEVLFMLAGVAAWVAGLYLCCLIAARRQRIWEYLRGRLVPLALGVFWVLTQRRGWMMAPAWAYMAWRVLRPRHGRSDG